MTDDLEKIVKTQENLGRGIRTLSELVDTLYRQVQDGTLTDRARFPGDQWEFGEYKPEAGGARVRS